MKCPECEKEMILTEEDGINETTGYLCKCGLEIITSQACEDILNAYFPDRNKEEKENIERVVGNFINYFTSNDKERKEMKAVIDDFVEDELE